MVGIYLLEMYLLTEGAKQARPKSTGKAKPASKAKPAK
jgi:hypothetical protein